MLSGHSRPGVIVDRATWKSRRGFYRRTLSRSRYFSHMPRNACTRVRVTADRGRATSVNLLRLTSDVVARNNLRFARLRSTPLFLT